MMREIPEHGMVFDGHDTDRPTLLVQVRDYLVSTKGVHPLDADEALANTRTARAWWGGDEVGFVGEDYPDAQPVTVVHC